MVAPTKLVIALLASSCSAAQASQLAPTPQPTPSGAHSEQVFVGRVLINTHVLANDGNAIPNLGPDDFRVQIDGKPALLESAEWVDELGGSSDQRIAPHNTSPADPGRLIILLFQWEVANQKQIGFLRMQRQALRFIGGLQPGDRAAVLLFDSRLWLVQDFTSRREAIASAIESVLSRKSHLGEPGEPALATGLVNGGKGATSIEKALAELASALKPIQGSKSLVFFGWGVGIWQPTFQDQMTGIVRNKPEYGPARRLLNQSETAVFCLDTSDGEHGLAQGLDRVAFDTGGFYLPTYLFPEFAIERLRRALRGYYALVAVKPQGGPGRHSLKVLVRTGQTRVLVLHRSGYDDIEDSPTHQP